MEASAADAYLDPARLGRDGFISGTFFPTVPPRVDYELTNLGRSLRPSVELLGVWAFSHRAEIQAARRCFDDANERAGNFA